ncbi:MAG: chemotaxis protein CheW [Spirochaetaceae bacterium]|nr:chemotaxis protein CheW [Spirochaetaceae bacterium]
MNEQVIEEIESQTQENTIDTEVKHMTTWLLFSISDKKYAVRSSQVLEIISDLNVYKLPFMPEYIEGLLNRRGDPFTVINPNPLFSDGDNKEPPEKSLFMIFKTEDDQLSLHISDILLFTEIDDSQLNLIPDVSDESFFLGTVSYNTEEIAVLNPNAFELLVRKDCGNV